MTLEPSGLPNPPLRRHYDDCLDHTRLGLRVRIEDADHVVERRTVGDRDSNFDSSAPSSVEHGGIVVDKFSTLDNGSEQKNSPSVLAVVAVPYSALTCLALEQFQ